MQTKKLKPSYCCTKKKDYTSDKQCAPFQSVLYITQAALKVVKRGHFVHNKNNSSGSHSHPLLCNPQSFMESCPGTSGSCPGKVYYALLTSFSALS